MEKHTDTNGSFFYAHIDFKKHSQKGEVPFVVTVNDVKKLLVKSSFKELVMGTQEV